MNNEWLLVFQILLSILFLLGATRMGREALIVTIILQPLMANLFVLKQINLFGFSLTASNTYLIAASYGLNLLQEFYGKSFLQKTIVLSLLTQLLFGLMGQMTLFYLPNGSDLAHGAYHQLFDLQPRIFLASLFAYFVVQQLDVSLFSWIRERMVWMPFALRSGFSVCAAQLIDTLLFGFLGLYGVVPHLSHIILMGMIMKGLVTLTMAPFVGLSRWWMRERVTA